MNFKQQGFAILTSSVPGNLVNELRDTVFRDKCAGKRCLLDLPLVQKTAAILKQELIATGHLDAPTVAIQAIAFNKTTVTNWKVAWHQDLMFPFANRIATSAFDLPCIKDGIHYARPPLAVLKQMLAVRLHLDDCDETNGPLRVSPGTHHLGIVKTGEIQEILSRHGETNCLAEKGEVLLMRPLTLHASSQASEPKHRRILHFVYYCGEPIKESWHRAI